MQNTIQILNNRYGEFSNYAIRAFNYLNGKINTVLIANKLIFSTAAEQQQPRNVLGRSVLTTVIVHIPDVFSYCDHNDFMTDAEIKGLILHTIAHELSHCDQYIDFMSVNRDQKSLRLMEDSNDANTLAYLNAHYDELQSILGIFDLEPVWLPRPNLDIPQMIKQYQRIRTVNDKIWSLLEFLTSENYIDLVKVNYISLNYNTKMGEHIHRALMVNKKWTPYDDTIELLVRIFDNQDLVEVRTNFNSLTGEYIITVDQYEHPPLVPISQVR